MRKVSVLLFMMAISVSLAACGKKEEKADNASQVSTTTETIETQENTTEEQTTDEVEKEVTVSPVIDSIVGGWTCVDAEMVDGDYKATGKEMAEMYGMELKDLFALKAYGDGATEVKLFGDEATVNWEETDEGYIIDLGDDEKLVAILENNQLIVTMTDTYMSDDKEFQTEIKFIMDCTQKISAFTLDYDLIVSNEDARKMSNAQNSGCYIEADGYLYGLYNKNGFGRAKVSVSDGVVSFSDGQMFKENCIVYNLAQDNEYIYGCLNIYEEYPERGIFKMKKGSDKMEIIYPDNASYMQLINNKIYFTDVEHKYCSMNTDGTEHQKIFSKDVYYPYLLDEKWLVYQDDADNESIHLYHMQTQEDVRISKAEGFAPVICGEYIYYYVLAENQVDDYTLARTALYSGKTEVAEGSYYGSFFIDGEHIFFDDLGCPSVPIKDWNTLIDKDRTGKYNRIIYKDDKIFIMQCSDGIKRASEASDITYTNQTDVNVP